MRKDLFNRYVWVVDTLQKHGRLTRAELNELWLKSADGDGIPIPARTFFHYRRAIESTFNIDIECDKAGRYFIEQSALTHQDRVFRDWLLDSYAIRGIISDSTDISNRIVVEEVPSARQYLATIMEAVRSNTKLMFTYKGYTRALPTEGIVLHPYMVELYKQRWYLVGYKESEKVIKTYALDRMDAVEMCQDMFEVPDNFDAAHYFDDCFGVTQSHSKVRRISLQVSLTQAKYFRALPLHRSQTEELHDDYSIFTINAKLSYELVREILSYGSAIKVIAPAELRIMVVEEMKKALSQY